MFGLKSDNGYTEILSGIRIKTINFGTDTLMTEFLLTKGSVLTEHAHVNEQTGYLIKGKIRLFIGESSREIDPGDSWNIPSNVTHKAVTIEDSVAVEVFHPNREDYLRYVNHADIAE